MKMQSLIAHYKEKKGPSHWFEPSTMQFFDSRLESDAYLDRRKEYAYFVTSEQFDAESPRLYSVRRYDFEKRDITTVGAFQAYTNLPDARHAAQTSASPRWAMSLREVTETD